MIKIKKFFVIFLVMLFGALGLTSCALLSLDDYKIYMINELQSFANSKGEENYYPEDWLKVNDAVQRGKAAIELADSKESVDELLHYAKWEIKRVETKVNKILPMYGEEEYSEGDGTESNPYIISNKWQLIYFSNQINKGESLSDYYSLTSDIDLGGMEWMPIGIRDYYYRNSVIDGAFDGVFDGNGFEISNFRISMRQYAGDASNVGLFGYNKGTIKNLGVIAAYINIFWYYISGKDNSISAGCLAGSNIGNIMNCYSIGKINLEYSGENGCTTPASICGGGLVGFSKGSVTNCYSTADVSVQYYREFCGIIVGGLVGGERTTNCFATGNILVEQYGLGYPSDNKIYKVGGYYPDNCYFYEGQIGDGIGSQPCTSSQLNDIGFYSEILGWSLEDWDLENIRFIDGKFSCKKHPRLLQNSH